MQRLILEGQLCPEGDRVSRFEFHYVPVQSVEGVGCVYLDKILFQLMVFPCEYTGFLTGICHFCKIMQTHRGQVSGSFFYDKKSFFYEKKRQYGGVACKNEFEEELKKMSTDSDSFTVSSIIDSNKQEKITG